MFSTLGKKRNLFVSEPPRRFSTVIETALIAAIAFLTSMHAFSHALSRNDLLVRYGQMDVGRLEFATILLTLALALLLYMTMRAKLRRVGRLQQELQARNATDPVSGALTRGHFLHALDEAIGNHGANGSVAVVLIDIDHFKQINDVFGHPAGDAVLHFCAQAARQAFPGAVVGRLGGDELALFVCHDTRVTEAMVGQCCDRYLDVLRQGAAIENNRPAISASLGIALAPTHSRDLNDVLSYADLALYRVKNAGRGSWLVFGSAILDEMRRERFIERELRAAITQDQLEVHYQPIVDANGNLSSLEALVRWTNPVRGAISPAEFIPVAERSQLICELGRYVMRRVCHDMPRLPDVPVNVNISARQLAHEGFLAEYLQILDACGVAPSRFILEITESALLETSDAFVAKIADIRAAGFRIALDDFGMGYSEFNQLRKLPFDIIKIDKSYIQTIGTDIVTDTFVSAVTQIAGQMDRIVVAEGIETRDDNHRASLAGCRLFQGYYYQAPMALDRLSEAYRSGTCDGDGAAAGKDDDAAPAEPAGAGERVSDAA